jgi:hypothetical protein
MKGAPTMNPHETACGALIASLTAGGLTIAMAVQSVNVQIGYSPRPHDTQDAAVVVPEGSVQMFRDHDFQGRVVTISPGASGGGQAHELRDGMEDSMSSLRWNLPSGIVVVFYEDDGGKGEQFTIWGKGQTPSLHKWNFNDKASQWAWYNVGGVRQAGATTGTPPAVISPGPLHAEVGSTALAEASMKLFKDKNFANTSLTIAPVTRPPAAKLNALPKDLGDSLTSLRWKLPPGVVVMFYQNADGTKQQVSIFGSGEIRDLDIFDFNDKASRWAWYFVGAPDGVAATVENTARDPIDLIASKMASTELDIAAHDLRARKNPTGKGTLVYVPRTQFHGVERHVIWIVVEGKAFALTAPAKMATPDLPMARDADDTTWTKTGIDKLNSERDAVKIVFERD